MSTWSRSPASQTWTQTWTMRVGAGWPPFFGQPSSTKCASAATDAALALARQGVSSFPGNPHLTVAHGALLLHKQQYQAAREWLLRARLVAPNSPQVWKFLGFAEYFSDRTDDAIRAWRKSLSLAPDSDVQRMLERAQRETVAETHYEQTSSGHFTLRFEGRQVAPTFRREILEVLERHYQELDRQLDASLRAPIVVILYTDQAFRDVTRAPAWAGALNNGTNAYSGRGPLRCHIPTLVGAQT